MSCNRVNRQLNYLFPAAGPRRFPPAFNMGQECRQQSNQWQKRANLEYKNNARMVRQFAQSRRTNSREAKGQPEKQAANHAHVAGHQFCGVHQDGRKRGRQNQSDYHGQRRRPKQINVRQEQRKRRYAQDGNPNDVFAPKMVAQRPANDCPRRHKKEIGTGKVATPPPTHEIS